MRVLVLVKATEDSENRGFVRDAWTKEMMEAMGRFNGELQEAGILRAAIPGGAAASDPAPPLGYSAGGLKPSRHGKRVAFDGARRTVIDGPFVRPNELVAGFWIWEVKDMDEALAWVKRCPNPMRESSEIEIRPFYEMADLR